MVNVVLAEKFTSGWNHFVSSFVLVAEKIEKRKIAMKKMIVMILALATVLSLAACGSKTASSSGSAASTSSAQTSKLKILDTKYAVEDYAICVSKDNSALLQKINSALADLKADGTVDAVVNYYISGQGNKPAFQQNVAADAPTLTMATNAYFPPYEYYEGDAIIGIDADIAGAIADKLGMKLAISDMDFGSIIAAVQTGKADMGMAGLTVTDERKQSVDFSDSYATGVQVVIVKSDSSIATLDDLKGKKIGVQENTTGDLYASDDFGDENVQRFSKGNDAVLALLNGQVDAVIIDNEPAKAFVAAN